MKSAFVSFAVGSASCAVFLLLGAPSILALCVAMPLGIAAGMLSKD